MACAPVNGSVARLLVFVLSAEDRRHQDVSLHILTLLKQFLQTIQRHVQRTNIHPYLPMKEEQKKNKSQRKRTHRHRLWFQRVACLLLLHSTRIIRITLCPE